GPEQGNSGGACNAGLSHLACLAIQHAKAKMAMCQKWLHTQFVCQGQSLLVECGCRCGGARKTLCCNGTEQAQGIGFIASFFAGAGKLKGTLSQCLRLILT